MRVELVAALVPFDLLRWALAPQQRQPPHDQPADAAPRRSLVLAFECRQSQLTDAALLQSVVRTAAAGTDVDPLAAAVSSRAAAASHLRQWQSLGERAKRLLKERSACS